MDGKNATATATTILSAEDAAALATGVLQIHLEFLTMKVLIIEIISIKRQEGGRR